MTEVPKAIGKDAAAVPVTPGKIIAVHVAYESRAHQLPGGFRCHC